MKLMKLAEEPRISKHVKSLSVFVKIGFGNSAMIKQLSGIQWN